MNLGVRKVDLRVSLRSSVIQSFWCEGVKGQTLQAGYRHRTRHAVNPVENNVHII